MIARSVERALAVSVVLLVPLALRLLSLRRTLALCDRWPTAALAPRSPGALANRVRRWLEHGRGPWASTCLTRSLVLYAMLRQHGYDPHLCVGVSGTQQRFDAHAWVTLGGHPVADPPTALMAYTRLISHGA